MLNNAVVVVTGASRGLGRAMALAVARKGAMVVAAGRTEKPESDTSGSLTETVRLIEEAGGKAVTAPVDVRNEVQVHQMIERAFAYCGRIDVLVNNAGLMVGDLAFADTTPQLWRDIMETNLWGSFLCCRAVVPIMIRQGGGLIINITSGAAVRTGFLNVPYGVSKAGLDRLTLGLGAELKEHGIACISLSPSASATDTVRAMYPDQDVDAWARSPELPARALCALMEDNPMQYTGQVLSVREYLKRKGLL